MIAKLKLTRGSLMKKKVFTLLLGVLTLLFMILLDRAEAATTLRIFSQNIMNSGSGFASRSTGESSLCSGPQRRRYLASRPTEIDLSLT